MSSVVLIGAQWGDEGKGKITDYLAEGADLVVRYQGGNNAGHTVIVGDVEYKLHLIPSGIISGEKICVIGNGVVVDPVVLLDEIAYLEEKGLSVEGLRISSSAHVIMPYHKLLDSLQEEKRGLLKIGTTKRGIGPCYADKISRCGIRMGDLISPEDFRELLEMNLKEKNELLEKLYGEKPLNLEDVLAEYSEYARRIAPYITDTVTLVNDALEDGQNILFEGAQGTLLDIDHGTYPFVTSSNPTAGGACPGAGVGPTAIDRVIGVTKAYLTRVGEGPFPTELFDEVGQKLGTIGKEFGVTTGRARRCGWFDAVVMRYAVRVNGITSIALTKLDVLDTLETIKICTAYEIDGEVTRNFPLNLKDLAKARPVYEEMPGWMSSTSGARTYEELPEAAQNYICRLEELCGAEASIVAVGPDREQTILRTEMY